MGSWKKAVRRVRTVTVVAVSVVTANVAKATYFGIVCWEHAKDADWWGWWI